VGGGVWGGGGGGGVRGYSGKKFVKKTQQYCDMGTENNPAVYVATRLRCFLFLSKSIQLLYI